MKGSRASEPKKRNEYAMIWLDWDKEVSKWKGKTVAGGNQENEDEFGEN